MILLSLGVSTVWTDRSVSPFADDPVFTGFADGIFAARCGKIVFIGIAKPLVDLFDSLIIYPFVPGEAPRTVCAHGYRTLQAHL